VTANLAWNQDARYARPSVRSLVGPMAIPELGLAYHVETTVAGVTPDSPASQAKKPDGSTMALQPEDVIVAYWPYKIEEGKEEPVKGRVTELRQLAKILFFTYKDETIREAWPSIFFGLQDQEVKKLGLRIERGGETHEVVLDAREDKNWPRAERGLFYQADTTLTRAESVGQAMGMGFDRTRTFVLSIYVQLQRLVSNRISFHMHATGPIGIFDKALDYSSNWYTFLLFLGMISVNLAVVNFLPIPVLDGGHMVFLIYEGIRGKPAPEWIRLATTYAGLVLILSLMLYVIYLDVSRLLL
jgi:regulator of sigma E protease